MECTINRVGDTYYDQWSELGHYARADDLARVAELNIKALRYPILWERYESTRGQSIDWSLAREGINKLHSLRISPIVGLLHHGSGPAFTNLLDDQFSFKFKDYAKQVAEAFPDITYYCPINEPLTTARFSGLYGFWYPHFKDPLQFARILLNELKGVVLAMQAIRSVNPLAKLIQTEDLAKTHSTEPLRYQAEFENLRRWLTFDLLCGKIDSHHGMWRYLTSLGINTSELEFFLENPCTPDILGLNYYVTSERFLDHRCELYPEEHAGGNGIDRYVDVAACRTEVPIDLAGLLGEVWMRYQIPLAITEVHLACTREEQMRWFYEIWNVANNAVGENIEVRGVTAWSLFGAYDWDSVATRRNHHYESGAFDLEYSVRTTAVGKMLTTIGEGNEYRHPVLLQAGWWRTARELDWAQVKPLLVIGPPGKFLTGIRKVCEMRRIRIIEYEPGTVNLESLADVKCWIDSVRPWGVINAFGKFVQSQIDADTINGLIVCETLSVACKMLTLPLMTFSGHLYDSFSEQGRTESYGISNEEFERTLGAANASSLIIRAGDCFSPWEPADFAFRILDARRNHRDLNIPEDTEINPTYLPHLLNRALDLFIDGETGICLLTNENALSWSQFATTLANPGCYPKHDANQSGQVEVVATGAQRSTDASIRSINMPSLNEAIEEYLVHLNY